MKFSPVVIFAYNRPDHLLNLLTSLSTNPELKNTDGYIFIDGPKGDIDLKRNQKTLEVAKREWQFKNKTIIQRESNLGLKQNILEGLTEICKKFDSFIVLEDDLKVSSNFLKYMNFSLNEFENNKIIQHVNGYNYKNQILKSNHIYQSSILFPWGWGTWSKYWSSFISNPENFQVNKIKNLSSKSIKDFNFYNLSGLMDQLEKNENKKLETWAVYWYQFVFLNGGLATTPGKSFTQNFGFDGSGQNSGNNKMFRTDFSKSDNFNFILRNTKNLNLNFMVSLTWHLRQKLIDRLNYHLIRRINKH